VGMPSWTLRVLCDGFRREADAERRGRHSHGGPWERGIAVAWWCSARCVGFFTGDPGRAFFSPSRAPIPRVPDRLCLRRERAGGGRKDPLFIIGAVVRRVPGIPPARRAAGWESARSLAPGQPFSDRYPHPLAAVFPDPAHAITHATEIA